MSGRPKGYARWNPRAETIELIEQVQSILHEYQDQLPLTVRQIFYRLVGVYGFEKTEKGYNRLCEHLVRARRARMIPFNVIRDDGTAGGHEPWFSTELSFWKTMQYWGENFQRDRLQNQSHSIEIWCEAAGMVPQLERVATDYSIPVYSTGGFSSVTVTKEIANRVIRGGRSTIFLHIGDYDPSGESIYEAMSEDARQFVEAHSRTLDLLPERVALTEEQVEQYDLPTAPPKASDSRSANWIGETCQAEAMPPDILADTLRAAIEENIDASTRQDVIDKEEIDKDNILTRMDDILPEIDRDPDFDSDE